MNDTIETLLALILLEMERANELLELAAGAPAEGPKRLSVDRDSLATGIKDYVDG